MLLGHGNGLRRIADLDAKRASGCRDTEVLVAETTHEIKRLLRWFLLRQSQRVRLHLRFDRRTHVRRRSEEAIRRHEVLDALMRTLEVVVLDEELQAAEAVREVGKHRLLQEVIPQRLPEPLDLAERLRVLRATRTVVDAVAPQTFLEFRLATPRGVLPALIGEHLARLSVLRDAALQGVEDQTRFLVMGHRPRHQVARVVVHEADEVHALMSP